MTKKPTDAASKSGEDAILERAKRRFEAVSSAESDNRTLMLDDARFRAGSPDNGWQWPDTIRRARESAPGGSRPCLTSNRIAQSVAQVVNDGRQNTPSIKCLPADDQADIKTAEMLNGVIRHIEYVSKAKLAYRTAFDWAVTSGVGYFRILTEYLDDSSFNQEILIRRIRNPLSVYLDPECQDPTGADARYCFLSEWLSKDEFKDQFKGAEPTSWESTAKGDQATSWYMDDKVRIAEYWERATEAGKLNRYADGSTGLSSDDDSKAKGEPVATRDVERVTVRCYKLCGHSVLETTEWAGKLIPVVRVIGNEFDIEGRVYYSGMVRNAKDDQRMINYHYSGEVEQVALQPKAPFVGVAGQFEGYEDQWASANTANHPYLEYNPVVDTDSGGQAFPAPQRQMPPVMSNGLMQIKQSAIDGLKAVTGQYDASLGARSNETSGRAIVARQREGDNSSFNYVDNLADAIGQCGRIIVDLIPSIYDTARIARILGEDGTHDLARIDPNAQQAYSEQPGPDGKPVGIFNPGVGRYDVMVVAGPSFNSRRQEAADGMVALTQANPQLWPIVGDLLVKSLDWPGADMMAKRLKAMAPPQVQQADAPEGQQAPQIPPQIKQQMDALSQQHEQLTAALHQAQDKLDDAGDKSALEVAKLQIDHYRAETERMKALAPAINPQEVAALAAQLVMQSLHSPAQPEPQAVQAQAMPMHQQEPPALESAEYPQEPPQIEAAEPPQEDQQWQ